MKNTPDLQAWLSDNARAHGFVAEYARHLNVSHSSITRTITKMEVISL
jgi:DNA-binding MurR/RpiR family transcriptional regulator